MAVYEVQAPDGSTLQIHGPAGATNEQVLAAAQQMYNQAPAKPAKGFGAKIDDVIGGLGRQVGLTARAGIGGAFDTAGMLSEPIRQGMNAILPDSLQALPAGKTADWLSDSLGLPKPETASERVGQSGARTMAGVAGLGGATGQLAKSSGGIAGDVLGAMAKAPGQQLAGAAAGGTAGEYVKETGGGPASQFAAALVGAFGGAGAAAGVSKSAAAIESGLKRLLSPKMSTTDVNVVLSAVLSENGVKLSQVPGEIRAQLAEEMRQAMNTGKQLNPDVVRRLADYAVVGATPTRGNVTLDPSLITQERNLAKVGANSSDKKLQALADLRNKNNARLISNLDEMGAAGRYAADPLAAGDAVAGTILSKDAAMQGVAKALYDKARDASGKHIPLDREQFVNDAYRNLAESGKGAFLPPGILEKLQSIRVGKTSIDGRQFDVPFDAGVIDNLETLLATASRGATDGNARGAIKAVRDALNNVQPVAVGRQFGGGQAVPAGMLDGMQAQADESATAALNAFREARAAHRARMEWQESTPAIRAILDDAVSSENLIKQFFLSSGNRSGAKQTAELINQIKGNPQAKQAMREAAMEFIKSKALGGAESEVGVLSQKGLNTALRQIGDYKLKMLFTPDEIAALKANARVASYEQVQPAGSAVNNSNTTGAAAGLLERLANMPLVSNIPYAGPLIQQGSLRIRTNQAMTPIEAMAQEAAKPKQQYLPLSAILAIPALQNR